MKSFDKNQKIGIISLAIFVAFFVGFFVLSNLIPDFTPNQRVQGLLAFMLFSPLCIAMFFGGKYFKAKNRKIGSNLIFVSVVLFIFGIIQALLSLLGAYGS